MKRLAIAAAAAVLALSACGGGDTVTVQEAKDEMIRHCWVNDMDCNLEDEELTNKVAANFAEACNSGFDNEFTLSLADQSAIEVWAELCPEALAEALER